MTPFTLTGAAIATVLLTGAAYGQTRPAPDSSGPQTAVPAPRPGADVPGGSSRNGVIRPPATGGVMPVIKPPAHGRTPVIPPSGTPRNQPNTQPR